MSVQTRLTPATEEANDEFVIVRRSESRTRFPPGGERERDDACTYTVAAKITLEEAQQLVHACEQDGVTRSAFLRGALVAALRARGRARGQDLVDIDLRVEERATHAPRDGRPGRGGDIDGGEQ